MLHGKLKVIVTLVLAVGLLGWVSVEFAQPTPVADQDQAAESGEPALQPKEGPNPSAPAKTGIAAWWADLAAVEDARIARALLALSASPRETVAFLKENLRPAKADPARVTQLLADLDNNQFEQRLKATEELEYLGKYVKADLEKALARKPGLEAAKRLEDVLAKLSKAAEKNDALADLMNGNVNSVEVSNANGKATITINGNVLDFSKLQRAEAAGPSRFWLRAVRAISLLEHIRTPQARQVLESLAQGESDALVTLEARAALERLQR